MNFPNATPLEWAWVAVAVLATAYAVRNLRQAIRNARYQQTAPDALPDWTPDPDLVHLAWVQVAHRALSLATIGFFVLAGIRSLFYLPMPGTSWDAAGMALYAIALLIVYTGWAIWLNRDEARLRVRYAARQDAAAGAEADALALEDVH